MEGLEAMAFGPGPGMSDLRGTSDTQATLQRCFMAPSAIARSYFWNLTFTFMTTGTGFPFWVAGSYCHCCTASSAA